MHRTLWGAAALAALVAGGCARYAPRSLAPSEVGRSLDARFERPLSSVGPTRSPDPAWLPLAPHVDVSDGLRLDEALSVALTYGPSVLEARGRLGLARSALLGAGQLEDPSWFLGPRIGLEDGGFVLPGSLGLRLPLGDQLGAERGVACASVREATLQLAAAELELLLHVRSDFVRMAVLRRKLEVLDAASERAGRLADNAAQRGEAGEESAIGVLVAKLEREDLLASREELVAERDELRAALLGRIGLLAHAPIELLDGDSVLEPLPAEAGAPRLDHPDVLVARAAYDVAEQELRQAVAQKSPTIEIGPDFEVDRGVGELGLGLGGDIPVSARHRARIAAARARRDMARRAVDAAVIEVATRAAAAAARLASTERRLEAQGRRVESVDEAERALAARLEAGEGELLEALAAQGAVARARLRELDLVQARSLATQDVAAARGLLTGAPTQEVSK